MAKTFPSFFMRSNLTCNSFCFRVTSLDCYWLSLVDGVYLQAAKLE